MEPRKTAARILPDSRTFAYIVVASVVAIFLAACAISFQGQAAVAGEYLSLQGAWRYLVPVVIDTSLLVYAAAALVRRARGESVRWVVAASAFWVGVSTGANVIHALRPESVLVGAILATLAPLAILMSSLTLESLLVAPPAVGEKLDREAALTAELAEHQATASATITEHIKETEQLRKQLASLEAANVKLTDAGTTQGAPSPGKPTEARASKATLTAVPALAAAGDRDERVLELKADGATNAAIASDLGCSVSTVKRILTAATAAAA